MTFSHKIAITISMIMLGVGIPHYVKYQQAHRTLQPSVATSLATQGKISVASIIPITTLADLHDLIAQTKTTQPLMIKVMKVDCPACQGMLNPYAIAAGNFGDKITFAEIDYGQLDDHEKENVANSLRLNAVPIFIGYVDGKEALRFSGIVSQEKLNQYLHSLLDSK